MKKKMRRLAAILLAVAMVIQQGSTLGVLAVEAEPMSEELTEAMTAIQEAGTAESTQEIETQALETKDPEMQAPETKAPETKAPETQALETKAPETQASETQALETKAPETQAPETKASETQASETQTLKTQVPETKAEETEAADQKTQTEETAGETLTENEQAAEAVTEQVTEAQSELISEAVTEEVSEVVSETAAEVESEKESETEEAVVLETAVMQEVYQKTVENATVPMVRYTVKIANKAKATVAEGISLKILLADTLSYKREDGETPGLASFESLGKAIEAAVFEEELTEEIKVAYANGEVAFWKDQAIAAGEEKTFVFCAEVKDGQTDVNALRNLWFVNGEAVVPEKIQWANTELLEVKPAIAEPQAYKYEDDKVVIKVTVPEGVELPYGAELKADPVPENSKEYADAVKAVEAANPDVVFNEHVFYDIYFVSEGKEVEPVGGSVSVQMKFKDTLKTDVKGVEGETTVVASHIKDNGVIEDVTDEVKLNKKDEVSSARFSTDSFSIMGISGGEEVSHMTDDKFDDYTLEFLLRNFNVVSFGNVTLNTHCMGGVLIKGDLSGTASGFADSANVREESYIGGYVSFGGRCNDRNNPHDENWAVYVGSGNAENENVITGSGKGPNTVLNGKEAFNGRPNDGAGPVLMTDDYVNWTTLSTAATNTMDSLAARSTETFSANYDWAEITVPAGSNVSLQTNGFKVKIKLEGDAAATTIINVLDSGSVNVPQVTGLSSAEDGTSMPIAFTFPNATTVNIVSELSPSFGHVIAPGATINVNDCNYNGCLVGGNMTIKGEGHMWPYTGGSLIPTSGGFSASKTIDGATPGAGQTFTFKLDELKDGVWTNVQTKSNNGSKVEFDKITYATEAEHWYIIYEDPDQKVTGYTLSDVLYLVKVIIKESIDSEGNTVYSVENTSYFEPKDGVTKEGLLKGGSLDEGLLMPLTSEAQFIFDNKELTNKEVEKVWVDENDKDGLRPESVSVQLFADNEAYGAPVELNADNEWHHTWENLPKKAAGKDISYTVEEIGEVKGYTTAYATDATTGKTTITNTHTTELTSKEVEKVWVDENNQDGLRPESISVQLLADNEAYGAPVELNADNEWHHTWENLPKKAAGKDISYTVEEIGEVKGYTTAYATDATTGKTTITNTHTTELTSKEVEKVWVDENNQDGLRPESISVQLLADNEAYGAPVELNADNEWHHTWENLPKKAAGKDISYTVEEIGEVKGYTTAYATDATTGKTTITNTHTTELTSKEVEKVWVDENNQDGLRPESISVQLLADDEAYGAPVELNADNEWHHTWENLPKKAAGKDISYTVEEIGEVKGYTTAYATDATTGKTTITNTHTTELTSKEVEKVWVDENDKDGLRPESISVQLLADNEAYGAPVELNADNEWHHTWENLPKKAAGKDISYTVEETGEVQGYTTAYVTDATTGKVTITNTHTTELTSKEVEKVWVDENDKDGLRPESISVQLLADDEAYGAPVELNADNEWHHTWENLPKKAAGKDISYTVEEIGEVKGYTTAYATDATTGKTTITNTHVAHTDIVLGATKVFDKTLTGDDFTFKLEEMNADGTVKTDGISVTAKNKADGTISFEAIPYMEEGTYYYQISEVIPSGDEKDTSVLYDAMVKKVTVTVEEKEGKLTATADVAAKDVIFTNKLTSVKVSKTDVATGAELEGAHIQILDKDGKVVEEWDSAKEAHEVKGLKTGETYTLKETVAPDGYTLAAETKFTLNADGTVDSGNTTTTSKDGVLLVEDSFNKVSIEKVDESGNTLKGAKLVIKDKAGKAVGEPWTTDGTAHEITGLAKGNYTLSEIEAPEGYLVSKDVPFEITGKEIAGQVISVSMTDKNAPKDNKNALTVTKRLRLEGITSDFAVKEATFYAALYSDEARTERVSNVKKIVFADATASSVTFENLAPGTYYVGETDENGTSLTSGLFGTAVFSPDYSDGKAQFTFEGKRQSAEAEFTNVFLEIPDGLYLSGELTVTKKILINGEEGTSDDTFYARVFSDAALTQPVSDVLVLDLAGGSSVSATATNLFIGVTLDSSANYYVAETDENGIPLDPDAVTEFEISIDKSEVVLSPNDSRQEVVITNSFTEAEAEIETEGETETETETEVSKEKTAPQTGDNTDYMRYLLLMVLSAGICVGVFGQKRRKAARVKK